MCIVIDQNTLAHVFNKEDIRHKEFKPVYDWIIHKNGTMIFGGSQYIKELRTSRSYLDLVKLLKDIGKAKSINRKDVDDYQDQIKNKIANPKFNDPHLIAIVVKSKCRLICTGDLKAHKFIKNSLLYPKKFPRPKIYCGRDSNKALLCDQNIVSFCKPYITLTKDVIDKYNL